MQDELVQCKIEIKSRNKNITELEVTINEYQSEINDLKNTIANLKVKVEVSRRLSFAGILIFGVCHK